MTLQFDLASFAKSADRELLRCVPQRVAAYYLALPLASEEGRVTVVTAYPENTAALHVLERLLSAEVVPVASSEAALQEAIAGIYPAVIPTVQTILAWTDDPAWREAAVVAAHEFGRALNIGVLILDDAPESDDLIAAAGRPDVALLVAHVSDDVTLRRLVHQSPASLLLLRGDHAPIGHVLIALRGYGSDHEALERVLPIMVQEGALATVLPLAGSGATHLNQLLVGETPARQHLQHFLHALDRQEIQLTLRLRQGEPSSQISLELAQGNYDLLVIAAEGEGRFVWQVLSHIDEQQVWPGRPVLIVRPPIGASALTSEATKETE